MVSWTALLFAMVSAHAGGILLTSTGDCPGPIDISASGLTPGGSYTLLYSRYGRGDDRLVSGPCDGTFTGLDGEEVAVTRRADADGRMRLRRDFGAPSCGIHLQLIDHTTCVVSNVEDFVRPAVGGEADFGPYTWLLGERGESCTGVCETIGLRCADLVESEWVETCDSNVCQLFYPDLPCRSDGDGPRISYTEEDGAPSPSSECVYHDWPWGGWSCDWVEREDDVRICPCE